MNDPRATNPFAGIIDIGPSLAAAARRFVEQPDTRLDKIRALVSGRTRGTVEAIRADTSRDIEMMNRFASSANQASREQRLLELAFLDSILGV
jgi:hypothetical protein